MPVVEVVSLAGRLCLKGGWVKFLFVIYRLEGRIQLYMRINEIGESEYELVKKVTLEIY